MFSMVAVLLAGVALAAAQVPFAQPSFFINPFQVQAQQAPAPVPAAPLVEDGKWRGHTSLEESGRWLGHSAYATRPGGVPQLPLPLQHATFAAQPQPQVQTLQPLHPQVFQQVQPAAPLQLQPNPNTFNPVAEAQLAQTIQQHAQRDQAAQAQQLQALSAITGTTHTVQAPVQQPAQPQAFLSFSNPFAGFQG